VEEKKMPSKVQIVKEIRAAQEQDPGRKEGERLFDERALAFQQVFVDRGPAPAIESDALMAEYFANWWVGEAYADKGVPLRAALKKLRAGEPVTAGEAYQKTLDQIQESTEQLTEKLAAVEEPAAETVSPETEAAYTLAEQVEIGDTLPPRRLSIEEMQAEVASLELFVTASAEKPSRRVARRIADLTKAIAKRS
jgi:hypothetical protein